MQTETLPGGTRVYVDALHPVHTDALLLAGFCRVGAKETLCDLGCGGGVLLLALADAGLRGPAVGIDTDPDALALLRQSIRHNGYSFITPVLQDLSTYRAPAKLDVAVANPPYHAAGPPSPNPQRAAARHQQNTDLFAVCAAAGRNLKQGGRLYLCWPAARAATLFGALAGNNLAPKRIQPVRKTPQSSARLLLVEARFGGGEGLELLADLCEAGGAKAD